jgi:serine/threonine protein kinase
MLRIGKNGLERVEPKPKPEPAPTPPPSQEARRDGDPYRLVGAEITLTDFDSRTRTAIEKLRLLRYVGAGGMGAVFYSVSPLRGPLAIKILKPDIVDKFPEFVELFSREVAAVKSLDHPNIVKFVGHGKMVQGYPFIAVEWLEGKTLDQYLAAPLSGHKVLTLFEQIGSALAFAHKLKIIHLDLKPENMFVVPVKGQGEEVLKVIDFGISRILSTYSGTTVTRFGGSLHYCSPEHFGGRVSARSDIFSLGVVLYQLFTGVLPIGGSYIAAKQTGQSLPKLPAISSQRPEAPPGIDAVIEKALQLRPDDRYQSVDELLQGLRSSLVPALKMEDENPVQDLIVDFAREAVRKSVASQLKGTDYFVESEEVRVSLDYYSDFGIRGYNQKIARTTTVAALKVLVSVESADNVVADLEDHTLNRDLTHILVVVAANPLGAYAIARTLNARRRSANSTIEYMIGWLHPGNGCFYLTNTGEFFGQLLKSRTPTD